MPTIFGKPRVYAIWRPDSDCPGRVTANPEVDLSKADLTVSIRQTSSKPVSGSPTSRELIGLVNRSAFELSR
jgi:hypothetical protein